MKYIYKITYPKGKIYIGQDSNNLFTTYYGSCEENYIQKDFTYEELQEFTIKKTILWVSDDADQNELDQKETEMILKYKSLDKDIGYNRRLPVLPK
jgi:hypothetical protein